MQAEGYTGAQGEQGKAFTAELTEAGMARWALTQGLQPQEGFTIVLSFPKGIVTAPTQQQRIVWLLRDNSRIWFSLIALLSMLGYCYRSWSKVGRDPQKGVVITRYEPPAGYSPAGLRYVRRMGYDSRCFTADVLALAVAGKLRINRDKSFFSDAWSLQKLAGGGSATAPEAEVLLSKLFAPGSDRLELQRTNHRIVSGAEGAHTGALFSRFNPAMFSRNGGKIGIAAAIGFGGLVLATIIGNGAEFMPPLMGLTMIVVLVVFGRLVKAPTVAGQKLLEEIEGFALYLKVAERSEIDRLPGPGTPAPVLDASRYERLLPFAVALEVEEGWTDKFTCAVGDVAAAKAASNLGWYQGGSISNLGSFSSSIGSSLSSQISSAGTAPGSSSGRSGGGSSGGGGGGGGGGGR